VSSTLERTYRLLNKGWAVQFGSWEFLDSISWIDWIIPALGLEVQVVASWGATIQISGELP